MINAAVFGVGTNSRQRILSAVRFVGCWQSDVLENIWEQWYDIVIFRQAKQSLNTSQVAHQADGYSRFSGMNWIEFLLPTGSHTSLWQDYPEH